MNTRSWMRDETSMTGSPFFWPHFAKAYTMFTGYEPEDFVFDASRVPMASLAEVITALIVYYTTILGGRRFMKTRASFKLNGFFKVHNLYLTIISGLLLLLLVEQIAPTIWQHGLLFGICRRGGGWTSQLQVLYYLNYLTKYLELLDTVFLVLKKKPLTFLHAYHHGATALLCYIQLAGRTPISWVPITLNLSVHVVMYWYYFQAARGIKIWWKQYITMLQILQFIIDLGFIYFAVYTEGVSSVWTWINLPHWGRCEGDHDAAWWGVAVINSYLLLFIGFYLSTYKGSNKQRS